MSHLLKIAELAAPRADVQFRGDAYGSQDLRRFLRDVMAMANCSVEGPRYIVVGVDLTDAGQKRLNSIPEKDFAGKPSYQTLVLDFIEPQIRLSYTPVTVEGQRLGIFEIPHCHDKPYMMRIDHSETLRRGDAYVRSNNAAVKLGRRQLQAMFEKKFHEQASTRRIEIGFPGEIIHKVLKVKTVDLAALPSAVASSKLNQMLSVQKNSRQSGSTTVLARLTHTRLFGSDDPYESRSSEELIAEMAEIKLRHRVEDEHFMFEKNAQRLQFVVYNQGDDVIEDANLALSMPNHACFRVASELPAPPHSDTYVDFQPQEKGRYPGVRIKDSAIQVSNTIGKIPCGEMAFAFDVPLRICAGSELKGRKFGIRYALTGANLHSPVTGTLRLVF